MITVHDALNKLADQGGAIVSSAQCSEMEISDAAATGRFFVVDGGYGFVVRYPEWLESRELAYSQLASASGI